MFGLPLTTTLVMTIIPALWIIYTVVFYLRSSKWRLLDDED